MSDTDFKLGHQYASIGFYRDDGDFQLLATLNNCDGVFDDDVFEGLVNQTINAMILNIEEQWRHEKLLALYRQDSPDYVSIAE